jgi:hypothetical protein
MTDSVCPRNLPSSRPFLLVWCFYAVVILLGVSFFLFPSGLAERMDFRQLYAGGYLARTDPAELYDYGRQKEVQDAFVSKAEGLLPFIRPAYEAWLFGPLSRLSYRTAYFCFLSSTYFFWVHVSSCAATYFRSLALLLSPDQGCSCLCSSP